MNVGDLVKIKEGFVCEKDCPADRRIGLLVEYDRLAELWIVLLNGKKLKFNDEWIVKVEEKNDS